MSKLTWNIFTSKYPTASCFGVGVPKTVPKGMSMDKNGKKLPTYFALLCEYIKLQISGDWTADSKTQCIKISVLSDVNILIDKMNAKILPKPINPIAGCGKAYSLNYKENDYSKYA